ncbi:MAG: hypothetical protein PHS30_10265 [Bacteroidales bacterium]|nr:hypothetical protein [Bacteroidales bacterium]
MKGKTFLLIIGSIVGITGAVNFYNSHEKIEIFAGLFIVVSFMAAFLLILYAKNQG